MSPSVAFISFAKKIAMDLGQFFSQSIEDIVLIVEQRSIYLVSLRKISYVLYAHALMWARQWRKNRAQ